MKKALDWEVFVWVRTLGGHGPMPQAWSRDYAAMDSNKKPKDTVLQRHELTEEDQGLGLTALMKKYPFNGEGA